jgi:hypothetical protein
VRRARSVASVGIPTTLWQLRTFVAVLPIQYTIAFKIRPHCTNPAYHRMRWAVVFAAAISPGCAALHAAAAPPPPPPPPTAVPSLVFSAGFTDNAVLQRGDAGVAVYGFAAAAGPIKVTVVGDANYAVDTVAVPWTDDSGCNATACPDPRTQPMPRHGAYIWRAQLQPQQQPGGEYTISVSARSKGTISISNVTYGDLFFCSGQSNMDLEIYFTFSVDELKEEMRNGKYNNLRTFEYGYMNGGIQADAPQFVSTWYTNRWNKVSESSQLPSGPPGPYDAHSEWARFSATCMYFGAELIDAKRRMLGQVESEVPIGLIQSAVGGTQIESWMSSGARAQCSNLDPQGGSGGLSGLYNAMVAPFLNYSVSGWLFYQGENNCHNVMGSSATGVGYGCALATLVKSWRSAWATASTAVDERLFGIATLAGGGPAAEGSGQNMAGMRWSQTANYGVWPNPAMPFTFGAQLYDIGEPFGKSDGNKRVLNTTVCPECPHPDVRAAVNAEGKQELRCCWKGTNWTGGNCTDPLGGTKPLQPCTDVWNCSLPEPETGNYGSTCLEWTESDLLPSMQHLAKWMKLNAPSGIPANQFMGSIHPRIKRPVGRRLAYAAAHMLRAQRIRRGEMDSGGDELSSISDDTGAATGPTIAGCRYTASADHILLKFNVLLLGGESLLLRKFDANETGGWERNPYNDSSADYHPYAMPTFEPSIDGLGAMVCTDSAGLGNVSTCACQSWDWTLHNTSTGEPETIWFCETGPKELWRPRDLNYTSNRGLAWRNYRASRYRPTPNIFYKQWAPAPLKPGTDPASVLVDLNVPRLNGAKPLAVRYAWPLFDGFHGPTADTCCPTRSLQDGHGPCLPGSCPLYTATSELPANPFFATLVGGVDARCHCAEPQSCEM